MITLREALQRAMRQIVLNRDCEFMATETLTALKAICENVEVMKDNDNPGYCLQKGDMKLEFFIGNLLDEYFFIDRDKEPMQFDFRILDPDFAHKKFKEILESRVILIKTALEAKSIDDIRQEAEKLSPKFERIRIWGKE